MSIKQTALPALKDVTDAATPKYQERFPNNDFLYDLPVVLRHVYVTYKEEQRKRKVIAEVAGYGTVEMHDRNFVFTPTDAYRAAKGYEERIEGRW